MHNEKITIELSRLQLLDLMLACSRFGLDLVKNHGAEYGNSFDKLHDFLVDQLAAHDAKREVERTKCDRCGHASPDDCPTCPHVGNQ